MSIWHSVYASGTRVSGHRFRPGHEALDVAPNTYMDHAILGQRDGVVIDYGADSIITDPGSASRGIWVRIRHDDGTSVEHCHLAGVPWPVDGRYDPSHVTGNPIGRQVLRGQPTGFFTGLTGDTNGYHDHLISRDADGNRIDPEPLLFEESPEPPQEDDMTEYEQAQLQAAWDSAEDCERQAAALDTGAATLRAEAKAIKNAVRMAKGEAVEQ